MGQSYAIPVRRGDGSLLPMGAVADGIVRFIGYARRHPDWRFEVSPVGIEEGEYSADQLGPLFVAAPRNCKLCPEFEAHRSDPLAGIVLEDPPAGYQLPGLGDD